MNQYQNQMTDALSWLQKKVFPHWAKIGVNPQNGIFVENLDFNGTPQVSPRRALVQSRQIYSFNEGSKLKVIDPAIAKDLVVKSTHSFIERYALSNGAFVHSVNTEGQHLNTDLDLYTQAFALFALAQGYEVSKDSYFKETALKLVDYLKRERRNEYGGYTEIKAGKVMYQSNPHMHLFEASLAWRSFDSDLTWKNLAREVHDLCIHKFIDSKTGFLAEHFNSKWEPNQEDGNFIFEPGHHYEWSWLHFQYDKEKAIAEGSVSKSLFTLAEQHGLSADGSLIYDEVWSNGKVNKKSSRFWPPCERIKSAVVLGKGIVADQAMANLFKHYILVEQGLWKDTRLENGDYADVPVKASSLYHIINAISEYVKHRPEIGE